MGIFSSHVNACYREYHMDDDDNEENYHYNAMSHIRKELEYGQLNNIEGD